MANAAIQYAGKIGFFDESTRAKFEGQASGDYGVLVGGRPETLVANRPFATALSLAMALFPTA